jgi:hypothetical protein
MEMSLEKYSDFNFHLWKVKIQMQLMNKNPWKNVKGTKAALADPKTLIEWESRDDKTKAMISLSLSDLELHHVDVDKSSKEIYENLNKLFGAQAMNAILAKS